MAAIIINLQGFYEDLLWSTIHLIDNYSDRSYKNVKYFIDCDKLVINDNINNDGEEDKKSLIEANRLLLKFEKNMKKYA